MFLHQRSATSILTVCLTILISCIIPQDAFAQPAPATRFDEFLQKRFSTSTGEWDRERFCPVSTSVAARRVLEAYGAIFAAADTVVLPNVCIFRGESETIKYQKSLSTKLVDMNGVGIDLQTAAADALMTALAEAEARGYRISPFDGAIAGSRTFGQTLMLWNSRFFPALFYWVERGRLSPAERDEIARLDLDKKIEKVLEWESRGVYFSTNRTRSILTSTAPPGSSQHIAFVAVDVAEYSNPEIRAILNQNGWFQTVIDDPPHFTYLGVAESDLPGRGLRAVYKGSYLYWVPNLSTTPTPEPTN